LHRNAQRLLEPLSVVNPFADRLTFADTATRTRRDHVKYLTLIAAVTLLHQHQREIKTTTAGPGAGATQVRYIETTPADITLANALAHEVLGRSLDELPPGTRRLLDALHTHVTSRCQREGLDADLVHFTRRQLREALGFGDTQLKVHLARLVDLELVVGHRLETGGFAYELAWHPGESGGRVLPGLLDPTTLDQPVTVDDDADAAATTPDRSGSQAARSGPGRGLVGPRSGGGRGALREVKPLLDKENRPVTDPDGPERAAPDPDGRAEDVVVVAEPVAAAGGSR
jgi:DNA primase